MIECVPTASVPVGNDAEPADSVTFDASVVGPSLNVTVPWGVPELEVTTRVKVTVWPNTEGPAEEVRLERVTFA